MSRQRGSYTIHSNWVDDLAPSLPGCAGWVLQKLDAQTNYKRQTLTVGQLLDVLPYKVRSIQQALAYLIAEGHVLTASDVYVLRGACTSLAPVTYKDVHLKTPEKPRQDEETPEGYSAIDCTIRRNKKELEDKEIKIKDSPLPPEGEAQESAAPVFAEGFELVEVPEQPAPSSEIISAPPQLKPKKATSKPKVPRGAGPALPELPAALAALPGMPEAWAQWFEYRHQRRLVTPPLTATGMANRLQRFAAEGDDPVEVIRNSIECGHQGLFRAEKPRNLKLPSRPQTTEAADARALQTAQAVYAALQEDERLAF